VVFRLFSSQKAVSQAETLLRMELTGPISEADNAAAWLRENGWDVEDFNEEIRERSRPFTDVSGYTAEKSIQINTSRPVCKGMSALYVDFFVAGVPPTIHFYCDKSSRSVARHLKRLGVELVSSGTSDDGRLYFYVSPAPGAQMVDIDRFYRSLIGSA